MFYFFGSYVYAIVLVCWCGPKRLPYTESFKQHKCAVLWFVYVCVLIANVLDGEIDTVGVIPS